MNQQRDVFTTDEIVIPGRLRSGLSERSVASLMESITRIGLRTPITVRWDREDDSDIIVLVAGRHRLEACKRLGMAMVDCVVFDGTETQARLWEIAENLHREDLTVQERSDHIAEWVRLTELSGASCTTKAPGRGRGSTGGVRAAERELGIEHTEANRAIKISKIAPEAKEAAKDAGIDDNQTVLLRIASEPSAEAQLTAIKREKSKAEAKKRNRATERDIALTEAQHYAEWLASKAEAREIPAIISWVEGCKAKDVIPALRRIAEN